MRTKNITKYLFVIANQILTKKEQYIHTVKWEMEVQKPIIEQARQVRINMETLLCYFCFWYQYNFPEIRLQFFLLNHLSTGFGSTGSRQIRPRGAGAPPRRWKWGDGDQAAGKPGFSSEGNPYQKGRKLSVDLAHYFPEMGDYPPHSQKWGDASPRPPVAEPLPRGAFRAMALQKAIKWPIWPPKQGRRHGFLSWGLGGRIVARVANLPQNTLKIEKKHRILATSFSKLGGGGRTTRFSKVRGSWPPTPPSATPCHQMTEYLNIRK